MQNESLVLLGRLGRPHGVRGALHVDRAGNHLRDLIGRELLLCRSENPQPLLQQSSVERRLALSSVDPGTGNAERITFAGITDRDTAADLTNLLIALPLTEMQQLAAESRSGESGSLGDLWYFELLGLRVIDAATGAVLGNISHVEDHGLNTVITVTPAAESLLTQPMDIPFNYPGWQEILPGAREIGLADWQPFTQT